jgi:cytochrome d ubiquinol oxidase subunit II
MMSLEGLAASVAVAGIVLYAVFGGADFGGGIWTLLGRGPRKAAQRESLERAIGPVWETNHVWLVLVVVVLFVVFPTAYAAIFTALYVPLFLALLGIVARGAAFAFHHYGARDSRVARVAQPAFSVASLLTPFMFGLCIGAVAGGHLEVEGATVKSGAWAGWLQPFALICGVIGLLVSAFIAAAFMVPRTKGELQSDFRRRAVLSSVLLGAATTVAIPIARWNAEELYGRLDRWEVLLAMGVTAALGIITLVVLRRGPVGLVEPLAGATVGGVVVAWALAQNPDMILPGLELSDAAASRATVRAFLIAMPFGAVILVPSLLLLYGIFSRDVYSAEGNITRSSAEE